jgi:hypothetical protein
MMRNSEMQLCSNIILHKMHIKDKFKDYMPARAYALISG